MSKLGVLVSKCFRRSVRVRLARNTLDSVEVSSLAFLLMLAGCDSQKNGESQQEFERRLNLSVGEAEKMAMNDPILASQLKVMPKLRANDSSVCGEKGVLVDLRQNLYESLGGSSDSKEAYFAAGGLKLFAVKADRVDKATHEVACLSTVEMAGKPFEVGFAIAPALESPEAFQISFETDITPTELQADINARMQRTRSSSE